MKNIHRKLKFNAFQFCVLIFLSATFAACSNQLYLTENTQYQRYSISDSLEERQDLNEFILPYKNEMSRALNRTLAYSPVDLNFEEKNSSMGNFVTDLMLKDGNERYAKINPNHTIDMVVMNKGGLRRTFNRGDLSVRSMFELLPFENEVVVVTLSGEKVYEMVNFLRESPMTHPVAGLEFKVDSKDKNFKINGKAFDESKNYRILTNDYLQKGGDYMAFFIDPIEVENLNIKLRDMFIEHLEKIDTIQVSTQPRYLE